MHGNPLERLVLAFPLCLSENVVVLCGSVWWTWEEVERGGIHYQLLISGLIAPLFSLRSLISSPLSLDWRVSGPPAGSRMAACTPPTHLIKG